MKEDNISTLITALRAYNDCAGAPSEKVEAAIKAINNGEQVKNNKYCLHCGNDIQRIKKCLNNHYREVQENPLVTLRRSDMQKIINGNLPSLGFIANRIYNQLKDAAILTKQEPHWKLYPKEKPTQRTGFSHSPSLLFHVQVKLHYPIIMKFGYYSHNDNLFYEEGNNDISYRDNVTAFYEIPHIKTQLSEEELCDN